MRIEHVTHPLLSHLCPVGPLSYRKVTTTILVRQAKKSTEATAASEALQCTVLWKGVHALDYEEFAGAPNCCPLAAWLLLGCYLIATRLPPGCRLIAT